MVFSRPLHGGVPLKELRSLGIRAEHFLDFSVNINPLGTSPAAREALASLDPSTYPDPESRELREVLAGLTGVAIERIVVGNGSTELIPYLRRIRSGLSADRSKDRACPR
jgi:threonine-phosphate decarboxylase